MGSPFTSTITLRTFLFEAKRISDADLMELEMVDKVPLLLIVTAFHVGEGVSSLLSLYLLPLSLNLLALLINCNASAPENCHILIPEFSFFVVLNNTMVFWQKKSVSDGHTGVVVRQK